MGYSTKTVTTANYQEMVGASFNSVGAEALDIQDITLVNDNADGGSWIKWWNPVTSTYSDKAVYCYEMYDPDDEEVVYPAGWGDAVNWYPVTKTFAPGEGFWFSSNKANVGITTAGAVEKTENQYVGRTVTTANKQIMVINAFPVALNIQDIALENDNADGGSWIKWWNSATRIYSDKAVYCYEMYDPDDEEIVYPAGWGDAVNWYPVTKSFSTGDGFWFSSNKANVTICFPNPFYVAP